ncbi:outer dynein arm-docking complex subunit 3 [Schistocerca cancellata]|uniref:outer dynein arm-docking complex subunit 3 n=1 Tax=Schistocerca cancellata TaxID=274614 RepID=UPI0021196C37|nr:outer dynein arm-docking complex subunit 3 [Schistocerca cancellata]
MPLFSKNNEKDLAVINRKIAEMKKKIQLSEGQRKAHFEECDAEKKQNIEKIVQLKKEIKEMYLERGKPGQCDELLVKSNYRNAKGVNVLRRKKNYEVAGILDDRICGLKKKLDVLRHQSRVAQRRMKKLASEYQELLQSVFSTQRKDLGDNLSSKQVCSLENQIHRVEMNMMEAEHVKKKYRSIRTSLLDDSVEFESTLKRLENMIQKQQAEINHLQEINKEAMDLRDMTKGTLVKQETIALNAGKLRERQLQEFRLQVEERRLELERLERRIFPTSRPMVHQDSTSSNDAAQTMAEETAAAAATDFLENAFAKLKEATGESETEEVLHRFLSQRETMSRLTYLKNITEEEKRDLEIKKDFMMAELEAFKFAEVKDKEQNMEEVENLKQLIEKQNKRKEKLDEQIKRITQQLLEINEILFGFCLKLQDVDDVPLPAQTSDFGTVKEVLHILEHKIQSAVQILCQREEARKEAMEEGSSQAYSSGRLIAEESWKFQQNQQKSNQESRTSILPTSETDEEDDVPTRSYLKRQAQIIVDAKSRRKQFNFNRGRK